jgi:hypothetical protein
MGVRVIHEQPVENDLNRDYLHVRTIPHPDDNTMTLATIERITEKLRASQPSEPTVRVKTLVQEQPMTPDTAVGLARRYAERKHIPVIYAETDEQADA